MVYTDRHGLHEGQRMASQVSPSTSLKQGLSCCCSISIYHRLAHKLLSLLPTSRQKCLGLQVWATILGSNTFIKSTIWLGNSNIYSCRGREQIKFSMGDSNFTGLAAAENKFLIALKVFLIFNQHQFHALQQSYLTTTASLLRKWRTCRYSNKT